MIGNDIVDLTQARKESNWQRKGFFQKLFTAHEQYLINTADDPERMVWLLWSMKESAYKANFRQTSLRRFAPQKISCQLTAITETEATGSVFYELTYQAKTILTSTYIASLAFSVANSSNVQQQTIHLDRTARLYQSVQVRQKLLQYCSWKLSVPASDILLSQQANGIPDLIVAQSDSQSMIIPVSISHHGGYGSFAIGWPTHECN
ncbi:4'-phosphopantetheinyl transferase family protein [Spirosoma aerolatum]|uniref:4'-phosphopantetheinyl transferase family protein n=1 Tax=Spirosoma aerolatum TaxID=1211326 RepID=UPI0009AC663C|nr:4'-phosphopantetheinyl transferase superfamily protein [Spirosoma aerolatum]